MWSIAHRQGIKPPCRDYWAFCDLVVMRGDQRNADLDEMNERFFRWAELIQSSPDAVENAVKSVLGGGYRHCNLTLQEVRFNPMKRNRSGERDLDHIIQSAIWGAEQAIQEYPQVRAGLILMMDREFDVSLNTIIVEKAIKFRDRGVIGVDVGGPDRKSFSIREHAHLFDMARDAGLGLTAHTGETHDSLDELRFVVREIKPDRIGHGIQCVQDESLMADIAEQGIVLETCPTSNLKNSVVADIAELRRIYTDLLTHQVPFTVNTDGPVMYESDLLAEQQLLMRHGILTQAQIDQCTRQAFDATFIK